MKRIGLFLEAEPHHGGAYQYAQTILDAVAALPRDRFRPHVIYTAEVWRAQAQALGLESEHVLPGVLGKAAGRAWRTARLPMAAWRGLHPVFQPLARRILAARCDLWIFPAQDGWSYQLPVRSLAVVHDLMHRYEREFPEITANGEYERREYHYRNVCRWSEGVLVDSEVGKRQLCESYAIEAERVHVLPFIAPKYLERGESPADFDQRYPLSRKFLLYPSQFWEHKNHRRVIRAAALVLRRFPDFKLVLVGAKKNGYDRAVALVRELGIEKSVIFAGYIPDTHMPELIRRARGMLAASLCGPTNIPPLEAFVMGCPLAVANVYASPAQVGDAALLFDARCEEAIAEAMARLWSEDALCAELSRRGRERAKSWGQPQFNARFESILESVTARISDQERSAHGLGN